MTTPPPPQGPPPGGYPPPGSQPGGYQPQPGSYPPPSSQPGGYQPQPGGYPAAPPPAPGYGPGQAVYPAGGLPIPPGTELASVGRRIGAYFLAIPLAIVTLLIGYLIWGAILWGKGTSPALKVLGMKVYRTDTRQVATFGTMAMRDIVGGIVEGICAIIALVSFIMFCSKPDRQTIHDKIGKTIVLHDPNNVLG